MKKFPEKLAQDILKKAIIFLKDKELIFDEQKISINIAEVSEKEIQELNEKYRDKKEPTDILSFGYNLNQKIVEGDLILCWEIIKKNADEDGIKPEKELMKNLVHGCLHLLGQKHSDKMFDLQNEFIQKNGL